MARVTTNGGRPSWTKYPLTRPETRPSTSTAGMTTPAGRPSPKNVTMRTDMRATSDPTERSIPAVAMTKVMPTAMTMIGAACRATFRKLSQVRKCSEANDMATTHAPSAKNSP